MAFANNGGFDTRDEILSEINMTPLVDVMLVLLIIFILALPVLTNTLAIELPAAHATANQPPPDTVTLSVSESGELFWQTEAIAETALLTKLLQMARQQPQPALQIQADRATAFERVATVLALAEQAGVRQLGILTEPK